MGPGRSVSTLSTHSKEPFLGSFHTFFLPGIVPFFGLSTVWPGEQHTLFPRSLFVSRSVFQQFLQDLRRRGGKAGTAAGDALSSQHFSLRSGYVRIQQFPAP